VGATSRKAGSAAVVGGLVDGVGADTG
jgi:hypothetical protein